MTLTKEEQKYRDLLNMELQFCNQNREKILKHAQKVYNIGINRLHKLAVNCCDFKQLEIKCEQFIKQYENNPIKLKEIAAASDYKV